MPPDNTGLPGSDEEPESFCSPMLSKQARARPRPPAPSREEYVPWLLAQIKKRLPVTTDYWESEIFPAIENFRRYVCDLPASDGRHHARPFGLFDHSLEAAYWCLRSPLRRELRRYDRSAALELLFWAGLLHDVGKTRQLIVRNSDGPEAWDPVSEPLQSFADRFPHREVIWEPQRSIVPDNRRTALIADRFVAPSFHERMRRAGIPAPGLEAVFRGLDSTSALDERVFVEAVLRHLHAADADSQWDDREGRHLMGLTDWSDELRRKSQHLRHEVGVPLLSLGLNSTATELIRALLAAARIRTFTNDCALKLRESFLLRMGHPAYRLFISGRRTAGTVGVRWGVFRRLRGKTVIRTTLVLDRSKIAYVATLARYDFVYYAVDACRKACHALGVEATNAVQRIRNLLSPFAADLVTLPADLQGALQIFDFDACTSIRDFSALVAAALSFDQRHRALLAEACAFSRELAAALAAGPYAEFMSFAALPQPPNEGETISRLFGASEAFIVNLEGKPHPRRLTNRLLRRLGLSVKDAAAIARLDAPRHRYRKELSRFERVRFQVLSTAARLAPDAFLRPAA